MAHVFSNGEKTLLVERDEDEIYDSYTPREDEGNVGTMVCQYPGYSLGDDYGFKSIEEKINDMIKGNECGKDLTPQLINYVKNNKLERVAIDNDFNRFPFDSEGNYYGDSEKDIEIKNGELFIYNNYSDTISLKEDNEWIAKFILDNMTVQEKLDFLESTNEFVILPLSVYEHSGITMSVGSKFQFPDAQWDASDVGFIYTTLNKAYKECGDLKGTIESPAEGDIEKIEKYLEAEVVLYNDYLQGDVYLVNYYYGNSEEGWVGGYYENHDLKSWGEENIAQQELGDDFANFKDYDEISNFNIEEFLVENYPEKYVFDEVEQVVKVPVFKERSLDGLKETEKIVAEQPPKPKEIQGEVK